MSFANKDARAAYQKAWNEQNKERLRALRKARYERNKKQILAQQREYNAVWRAANPEYAKTWRAGNVALRKSYYRDWAPGESNRAEAARPGIAACGICSGPTVPRRGWAADHCHDSGCWRGFTCTGCNVRLSRVALSDKGLLSPKEIAYLRTSECAHCRQTYE